MPNHNTTWVEIISAYWPVLAVSFGVSLVMTPLCRRFALAHQIVDRPDDYLKPHHKPIPYMGGVAIFLGWAVGLALAAARFGTGPAPPAMDLALLVGIGLAGTFTMVIGLLDDVRHVRPVGRLLAACTLGILLIVCGLGDDFVFVFLKKWGVSFLPEDRWVGLALSMPFTLFIIMGACNATNVLDGLDGLCAGVMGVVYTGYVGLALVLHARSDVQPCDVQRLVLSLAALGATLGFLPYNRYPATIFMGDAGSMFLGMNAAILILLFAEAAVLKFALAAIMVFALPVADMSLAMFRRWRAGRPLMLGDRSHFYDQLVDRGRSVPRVVALVYALAAGYTLLGWAAVALPTRLVVVLYAAAVVATVVAVVVARMVHRAGSGDHLRP
ncbi:MAG: MraY family glycosyltransferase [Planctomycetota bacterium]